MLSFLELGRHQETCEVSRLFPPHGGVCSLMSSSPHQCRCCSGSALAE